MRTSWPTVAALALLAPLGLHAPSQAQSATDTPYARVVVKFKADAPVLRERAMALSAATVASERASALSTRVGVALNSGGMVSDRAQTVTANGVSSEELARRLSAQADVEYAEPVVRHHRFAAPNDPRYAAGLGSPGPTVGQWYLRPPAGTVRSAINAEEAWDITIGSTSVVVAVLDTGVRFDHDDLLGIGVGNLLAGYDMVSEDRAGVFATANDGNGRDTDPSDPGDWVSSAEAGTPNFRNCAEESSSWHGTQTASLIGALTNNGNGMASVGRTVKVLPVRVLGKCGGYTDDIAAGIRWAAGIAVPGAPVNPTPAKIINMSLGGSGACSQTYRDAINEAVAQGVLVVVSAGNSAGHAVSSPANCNGVLAVTGLRHAGSKVGFADVGPEVAIAAPGGNCVTSSGACLYPIITATNSGSTTPVANSSVYTDSGVNAAYGTSFSSPLVAGTAALMLSVRPTMTVTELRAALQGSTRPFPSTGSDPGTPVCQAPTGLSQNECYCTTGTCGAGMLDAHSAVIAAQSGLQARISSNLVLPRAAQAVTLSATGSYLLAGRTLATYQWTLVSGGGIVTALTGATNPTVTVTPTASGWFTVRLTVTDSSNAISTSEQAVYVGAAAAVPVTSDGGGGGGALGLVWLAGLALAVVVLQLQRRSV
ncbi:MAG: S8 family peptidase [Rhizobacter sp.]